MNRIQIIKQICENLNQNSIRYCILRNYDFLLELREPKKHSERSIDLAVHKDDYKKFHNLLGSLGFQRRKKLSFSHSHRPYFFLNKGEIISFDVQVGGIHWNDICYFGEELFEHSIRKSFFYVPDDNDTFVMLLVHSILGKRYFKLEYKETITNLSNKIDEDYVEKKLSEIFNKKLAGELLDLAVKRKFEKILKKRYTFIATFVFKSLNDTITFTKLFLRWIRWKKFGKLYPLISIIGPDGAGKSTMVNELTGYLKGNYRVSSVYAGRGKNQLVPLLKLGKIYKKNELKRNKGNGKVKNEDVKLLYTLAAPVFTLDLLLRYFIYIFPKRIMHNVVVTDRYCSDIFLMRNIPDSLRNFLLTFFPKPTITFYLYNEVEILLERRPNESLQNLQRQLYYFDRLIPRLDAITVSTENLEENKDFITQYVTRFLLDFWY